MFFFLFSLASLCAKGQTMPQPNISHHADKLPALTTSGVKALAQSLLKAANTDPNMTVIMKDKLNAMAKSPTLNVAGTGEFYLSLGLPLNECGYIIAKGILLHPVDPYAANGLGVYYRDSNSLVHALQCFFYADKVLPKTTKSPYIYANIAWASFYYGDFPTAQTYFTKALTISSNFQPALEGNATLAYAKGDLQALYLCLAKELSASLATKTRTFSTSGGGAGPSTAFTSTCGGMIPEYDSDPTTNKTFDNLGTDDDSPDQDPSPGADVTFPEIFRPVFVNNLKDVNQAMLMKTQAVNNASQIIDGLKKQQSAIDLKPWGITYFDEEGNIIHTHDYSKFLTLHGQIVQLLEQRIDWHIKKEFGGQLEKNYDNATNRFADMNQQMSTELAACGSNQGCPMEVFCKWTPKFETEGSNFLDIGSRIWGQLYDKVNNDLNWFLKNDGAIVTRVHEIDANKFINLDRELELRVAILKLYGEYIDEVLGAVTSFSMTYTTLSSQPLKCELADARTIGAPDPFAKRPKHINEFPDPNCQDITFSMVVGSITDNCHTTTIATGGKMGPFQIGMKYATNKDLLTGQVKDPIYTQNNNFGSSVSANLSLSAKFDEIFQFGSGLNGSVTRDPQGKATSYTAGAEASGSLDNGAAGLGGKASATVQIDADGNILGYSTGSTATGSLGGNVGNADDSPGSGYGVSAVGEANATSNYDANGNYTGGRNSVSVSAQGSATSNTKEPNGDIATQGNFLGIQENQVIQVVAGQQQQTMPWSGQSQ